MPSRRIQQVNFSSGELDPRAHGRLDIERYGSALAKARNVLLNKVGSAKIRPGLRWVADVPSDVKVQLLGWTRNDEDYLIALGADTNLFLYDSADALVATLAGSVDGYVLSVYEKDGTATATPASPLVLQHSNIAAVGSQFNGFARASPPLANPTTCRWTSSLDPPNVQIAVLVRSEAAPSPAFAIDDDTFHDQNTNASPWSINHDFTSDANLCLVLVSGEVNSATPVSSAVIDPGGASETALSEIATLVQDGERFCSLWGVHGISLTGTLAVDITFASGANGSAEVITFISAERLPEERDVASRSFGSESVNEVEIEIPDGGFGPSSVGLIDSASDSQAILFFEENVAIQWLHMTEADGWVFEPYPIQDYPYHRFQPPGVTLTPSGTTGNITLTTSEAHWKPEHVGSIVRYGSGQQRIEVTGYTSSTVVDATVLDTLSASSATTEWDEQVWSSGRGFAISGAWHQGRLVVGGARDLPDGVWASKVGEVEGAATGISFDLDNAGDDDAIWARIRADEGVSIRYVRSQGPLVILASGTEWIVPQQPVTPTNISFDRQASQGAARLKPADLDGAILYMRDPRGALGEQPLIHIAWDELSQRYRPIDIGVLGQHLIVNPVDLAGARGTTGEANNLLYLVNSDGTIAVLHLPAPDRPGVTLIGGDGNVSVYSVAVSGGRAFCAAEFNGAHRIFELDPDHRLDASVIKTVASGSVTGLDHLEGLSVRVRENDATSGVHGPYTVSSGAIDVSADIPDDTEVEVGLPYTWQLRTLALEASPATLGTLKSVVEVSAQMLDTRVVDVKAIYDDGRVDDTEVEAGDIAVGTVSGVRHDRLHVGGWGEAAQVELSGTMRPAEILSLNIDVEF